MTNYNDGKWHVWAKNEKPPLHDLTRIKRVFINANGDIMNDDVDYNGDHSVCSCFWTGKGVVLAFRVTKEHREPREWWIKNGVASPVAPSQSPPAGYIHVREVLE